MTRGTWEIEHGVLKLYVEGLAPPRSPIEIASDITALVERLARANEGEDT
jgi:hypothetical protein